MLKKPYLKVQNLQHKIVELFRKFIRFGDAIRLLLSIPDRWTLSKTDDESLTIQVATEKGRSMGNAVGCPTEWADEMEEREILQNSAFF